MWIFYLVNCVGAQLFGPSLWDWGFFNNTTYTMYPTISYTRDILFPHGQKEYDSACHSGSGVGYACPHLLLFSTDLLLAAERDGLGGDFFYGTSASKNDNDCGKCFQVKLMDAQVPSQNGNKQLILQITNSGFDVVDGQFDVHMGAGGFGYYTACNQDCSSRFCQGGACSVGMFETRFDDWTKDGDCYGGGLKMLSTDYQKVWDMCGKLTRTNSFKEDVLRQSCWYSNLLFYHQNFFSTDSVQVQCPVHLTKTTGLKRNDESSLPLPHIDNSFTITCRNRNCITSYQDCCKMSCAWNGKGSPDSLLSRVYTCDKSGLLLS